MNSNTIIAQEFSIPDINLQQRFIVLLAIWLLNLNPFHPIIYIINFIIHIFSYFWFIIIKNIILY